MAKALGNGMPIGACWARREVAAAFEPGDHATTFGGQPLATAAARDGARRSWSARTCRPAPTRAGEPSWPRGSARSTASSTSAGLGLLLGVELDPESSTAVREVAAELLGLGLVVNAVTPDRAAARAQPADHRRRDRPRPSSSIAAAL